MRRLVLVLGLACLLAGCARLDLFRRSERSAALSAGPRIGMPAPDIDGEDFDGKRLRLSDYRGKVTVVVFWASWCPPCRAMIPHERELVETHRGAPFALLSVNSDEDQDQARAIMARQQMTWPNWKTSGTSDPIARNWGVKSWPAIYVLDVNGIVRYMNVRGPQLENAVDTLLAEMAKEPRTK
jgi:thiol-disulfide isomerase/thioredoxin